MTAIVFIDASTPPHAPYTDVRLKRKEVLLLWQLSFRLVPVLQEFFNRFPCPTQAFRLLHSAIQKPYSFPCAKYTLSGYFIAFPHPHFL